MEKISARYACVISLSRMEKDGRYSNIELDATIKKYALEGAEKALYSRILYGVLEHLYTIDAMLNSVSNRNLDELDGEIRAILRSGTYQIHYLDKIPLSAAVNESVKLASRRGAGVKGYINAVLRAVSKINISEFLENLKKKLDDAGFLSIKYSVCKDTVSLILSQYGFDKTEKILKNLCGSDKGMSLRVNTLKTTADLLCSKLTEYGASKSSLCDDCVKTEKGFFIESEECFINGEYFVQSEPSALCAAALGAKKGECVIDACACPGGKTFAIAIDMENTGEIIACDLHENKLSLIHKGAKRLGIDIIKTKACDGRIENPSLLSTADRVICDVPCSCLGTISKKPEIRYKSYEEYSRLPQIQLDILKNNASYVKKGGVLVYSTCTFDKNENEAVVKSFLEENKDFSPVFEEYSDKFDTCRDSVGTCFLPCENCADGFYISKLIRN